MKYYWDKRILRKMAKNPITLGEAKELIKVARDPFSMEDNLKFRKAESFTYDLRYLKGKIYCYPFLAELMDNTEGLRNTTFEFLNTKNTYSLDTSVELTKDFFSTVNDPDIQKAFNHAFSKLEGRFRRIHHIFNAYYKAHTYFLEGTKDFLMDISPSNRLDDTLKIDHEFGHVIGYYLRNFKCTDANFEIFDEIESTFLELIAMDFLEKTSDFKEDVLAERIYFYKQLVEEADIMLSKFDIFYATENILAHSELEDFTLRKLYIYMTRVLDVPRKDINDALKVPAEYSLQYIISQLIALELYDIYLQDPNEAYRLYKIIISLKGNTDEEIMNKIKELGISPASHITTFTRKLTRN